MRGMVVVGLLVVAGCGKAKVDPAVQPGDAPDGAGQTTGTTPGGQPALPPARTAGDGKLPVELTTLDAVIGSAPKSPGAKTVFTFVDTELTIELPDGARIETDKDSSIAPAKVWFGSDVVVDLNTYVHDLSETLEHWAKTPDMGYPVARVWRGPAFQLVETAVTGDRRFFVEMLPSDGPVGLRALVAGEGIRFQAGLVTRAQAVQILATLRTIALKSPLPADPVERIEALGGTVDRDRAGRVEGVHLSSGTRRSLTGFALPALKAVPDMRRVTVFQLPTRSDEWSVLADLPNLESLDVRFTHLGEGGLAWVAKCPRLKHLTINSCGVRVDWLRALRPLKGLTDLKISVAGTGYVSGPDLQVLPELPGLTELELFGTRLTDEMIAPVGRIRGLRQLSLRENPGVTDAGLDHLAPLQTLRRLDVSSTMVTAAGAKKLAMALPECRIEYPGGEIRPEKD